MNGDMIEREGIKKRRENQEDRGELPCEKSILIYAFKILGLS